MCTSGPGLGEVHLHSCSLFPQVSISFSLAWWTQKEGVTVRLDPLSDAEFKNLYTAMVGMCATVHGSPQQDSPCSADI